MQRNVHPLQGAMAATGLLILIFDSSLALEGAGSGIELCVKTVIPSLFPFFVLSAVLTDALRLPDAKPVQILARFLGIPASAVSVLIPAVLGGYPVGAKSVGDLYQQKQISRQEAQRMLAFCSNAGPSFLFGMVSGFFPEKKAVWLLWLIHICSAALTAAAIPATATAQQALPPVKSMGNNSLILSSAKSMCLVCCWVVLFRILIAFLNAWVLWAFPVWVQVFLMGLLELTNGCCSLLLIENVNVRFILCSCMLALGGICVLFQTISVTKGLPIGCYVKGKMMQTLFSFLLSCLFVSNARLYFAGLIPILVLFLRKTQNRYGNPNAFPV